MRFFFFFFFTYRLTQTWNGETERFPWFILWNMHSTHFRRRKTAPVEKMHGCHRIWFLLFKHLETGHPSMFWGVSIQNKLGEKCQIVKSWCILWKYLLISPFGISCYIHRCPKRRGAVDREGKLPPYPGLSNLINFFFFSEGRDSCTMCPCDDQALLVERSHIKREDSSFGLRILFHSFWKFPLA